MEGSAFLSSVTGGLGAVLGAAFGTTHASVASPTSTPESVTITGEIDDGKPGGDSSGAGFGWVFMTVLSSFWAIVMTFLWWRLRGQVHVLRKEKRAREEEVEKNRALGVARRKPSPMVGAVGRIWLV